MIHGCWTGSYRRLRQVMGFQYFLSPNNSVQTKKNCTRCGNPKRNLIFNRTFFNLIQSWDIILKSSPVFKAQHMRCSSVFETLVSSMTTKCVNHLSHLTSRLDDWSAFINWNWSFTIDHLSAIHPVTSILGRITSRKQNLSGLEWVYFW